MKNNQTRVCFSEEDRITVPVIFYLKNTDIQISLACSILSFSEVDACLVVTPETLRAIDFSREISISLTKKFQKAHIKNAKIYVEKDTSQDELYVLGVKFFDDEK